MERKALLHSGITMDTNKNHTSYSEDFIQAFKNRISSHMNVPEKCEVNPESLSKEDLEELLSSRISSLDDFIKAVFAAQREVVSQENMRLI